MMITEIHGGEPYEYYPLYGEWIVAAPGVCGGTPTIKYTRLGVSHIIGFLKRDTAMEIAENYGISLETIKECIEFAQMNDCEKSYCEGL